MVHESKPLQNNDNLQNNQSPFPSRVDLPSWLNKQDLSETDLPYIHNLLSISFKDWQDDVEGFPWVSGTIVLLHPDGTSIALQHNEEGQLHPFAWRADTLGATAANTAMETGRPTVMRAEEHTSPALKAFDSLAVPVFSRTTAIPCALLACLLPAGTAEAGDLKLLQAAALHFRGCMYRRFENMFVGGLLRDQKMTEREQRRREILFEVIQRLNAHIDVENVLSEVLDSLEQMYPICKADLFLSQDYSSQNQKVQPLAFHLNDMDLCKLAFVDGQIREDLSGGRHQVALPLSGKQGVYGVLRLNLPENQFDEADIRFLSMLAAAAGASFEQAKLHEQANVMIGELRLINEITQRLNRSLKLSDTMQFASAELLNIFKADYSLILQYNVKLGRFVVLSSNVPALHGQTYTTDSGFSGVLWTTKEPIILSDYDSATPVRSQLMDLTQSRSLLASPMLLNGDVIGAVLLTKREANHFSYDNYKLLHVLSAHLGLAMSNASLHAEVRRMVITDNLTGLFARHHLNERIGRKQMRDNLGSLIVVDIDHFKQINDTYGHQVGDDILTQVGGIIRTSIRDTDIAARWGGEELAVYLPLLGLEQTEGIAERIRQRVQEETNPTVTVSCGISAWRSSDEKVSVESLFYKADMALYEAKHQGRNRIVSG